ncbi:hypothetical protein CRENBAI_006150 [Crenichthys baileyi]|uniref:Uncharacterized protein n=1 Tax=Crenichthys baileyi TaxID=28760 RepID=A0AAV9QWB7_9TELE
MRFGEEGAVNTEQTNQLDDDNEKDAPPPVFMDQRREQLHQCRSGSPEMKSCVAVGKHLAVVRGAEEEKHYRQMCCRFFWEAWKRDVRVVCMLGVGWVGLSCEGD